MSSFCGTFFYMAPEFFYNVVKYNEKIDIYALGVILYEMLVGVMPDVLK